MIHMKCQDLFISVKLKRHLMLSAANFAGALKVKHIFNMNFNSCPAE